MILSKKIQAEWRPRRRFRALSFDGIDDYVEIADSPSLRCRDFTVAFSIYPKVPKDIVTNPAMHIIHKKIWSGISPWGFYISNSTRQINFVVRDYWAGTQKGIITQIEFDKWNFVTGKYNDNVISIYLNGERKSFVSLAIQFDNTQNYNKIWIGNSNSTYAVGGTIGSVFMYNVALSDSEIKQLSDNPFNPPRPENLVLWLAPGSIDTSTNTWYDLSQYGNHGTIYGAQVVEEAVREVIVK